MKRFRYVPLLTVAALAQTVIEPLTDLREHGLDPRGLSTPACQTVSITMDEDSHEMQITTWSGTPATFVMHGGGDEALSVAGEVIVHVLPDGKIKGDPVRALRMMQAAMECGFHFHK